MLSKFAFLINPSAFSLYDRNSKGAVCDINKETEGFLQKHVDTYSGFILFVDQILEENRELLEDQISILASFKGTEAYNYFSIHQDVFIRRILDKYFWLHYYQRHKGIEDSEMDNNPYQDFIKIGLPPTL